MAVSACQAEHCGKSAKNRRNSFNLNKFRPLGRDFSDSLSLRPVQIQGANAMDVATPKRVRIPTTSTQSSQSSPTDENGRLVFTFDQKNSRILESMTRDSRFSSIAETVSEALRVLRGLQSQAKVGYSDVIVQNPETLERKKLVVDFLDSLRPARGSDPTPP